MARKYYIIRLEVDCEGYNTNIEYIGTNFKAASARYFALYRYIRERDFINEGVDADQIEESFRSPIPNMRDGDQVYSYINDQNTCYESLVFSCHTTNHFTIPPFEDRYKRENPNAKY